MKKLTSIFIVSLFALFHSCTNDPENQNVLPPQADCPDTLALSENLLMPGKVGSYWKYKFYAYNKIRHHENDSMWSYKDFNSFGISFSDTSLIIRDSTKRKIANSLTVHYGNYYYNVNAYNNNSLSYEQTDNLHWLYWIGQEGIFEMGGYDDTDTLISKGLKFPYPLKKGEKWEGQFTYYESSFKVEPTILSECVADNEKLVTPFFTAESCYVILTRVRQSEDVVSYYDYYSYYVPNRGLVCQVEKGTSYDNRSWSIESILIEYEHFVK